MRSFPLVATLFGLSACGGGRFYTTLNASPTGSPADAIACARARLDTLGYQLVSIDDVDHRLTVRKIDNSIQRADPQYRRNLDRIEVSAAPAADGKTSLQVVAHSFARFRQRQAERAGGCGRVRQPLTSPVPTRSTPTPPRNRAVASPSGRD
jgi:hypothetical protein